VCAHSSSKNASESARLKAEIYSIAIALLLWVGWSGCGQDAAKNSVGPGQPLSVEWREGDVVVALGTSLTFGYGAGCKVLPLRADCAADSAYPALLSERLLLPIANLGQPGATTRDGLLRTEDALALAPVLALVEFGGNDLIQGIAVEEARANLEMMVDRFHAAGIAVVLLSSFHPDMIENTPAGHRLEGLSSEALSYYAMLVDLAARRRLPLVEYLFEGIWWKRELMYDSLHPNGMGYLRMEENILRGLRDFLHANRMLK
jgi:acyl-CoA thioesterase I